MSTGQESTDGGRSAFEKFTTHLSEIGTAASQYCPNKLNALYGAGALATAGVAAADWGLGTGNVSGIASSAWSAATSVFGGALFSVCDSYLPSCSGAASSAGSAFTSYGAVGAAVVGLAALGAGCHYWKGKGAQEDGADVNDAGVSQHADQGTQTAKP